ncbi:MAG: VTT domain-containing protein [Paenisporosarcina sp.]
MDQFDKTLQTFLESAGWLAPILFVLLHLLRPFFFLPVIVVCIAGGVLFGFFEGAILSFIGLSLMSLVSYLLVMKFPKFRAKITKLKEKMFKDNSLSVSQVMILRIMPFVHFHLLSLYLIEMSKTLKEYMIFSMLGVIMPAILYTAFGEVITELPWYLSVLLLFILGTIFMYIGNRNKLNISVK